MADLPLLNGQDASGATSLEAQYLSEEQPDFGQVIAHDPEGVVAYIEKRGVQDLGTFKVQVPAAAQFKSRPNAHRSVYPCLADGRRAQHKLSPDLVLVTSVCPHS